MSPTFTQGNLYLRRNFLLVVCNYTLPIVSNVQKSMGIALPLNVSRVESATNYTWASSFSHVRKPISTLYRIFCRARPIYRSADIYRPIMRLADISYRPSSTDKLSAINKNVSFTILLISARFLGAYACVVAHTFKHENDASERACTHTQMPARQCMCVAMHKARYSNNTHSLAILVSYFFSSSTVEQRFTIGGARKDFWGCKKNLPILPLMNGIVDFP